ncbi:hypothetical protein [Micromonospora sp. SH-82]|uniref:hypothetical protein n=1 Tax=Micromonospora sp. SH-82 TaxID=3132938 RepID=UPI003EC12B69
MSKPCVALWGLMAMLLVAAGMPTMIAVLGAVTATAFVLAGWLLVRRGGLARSRPAAIPVTTMAPVTRRRRS